MSSDSSWKKISEKLLLSHPRLTVYEDEVELPSGHITHYLRYADTKDAACTIAVNSDGKILLQREYSYPPDTWMYQLPGGAIENNESPESGAARELAEEAALQASSLELLGWFFPDNRRRNNKFYVFLATDLLPDTTAQKDAEESFETYWFKETEIDTMIQKGDIVNYAALAAWSFYKTRRDRST